MLELLAADDETLLDRHGRWYIAGRDPRLAAPQRARGARQLRATRTTGESRTTLARYRHGDDALLAEHAQWASARLGLVTTTRS